MQQHMTNTTLANAYETTTLTNIELWNMAAGRERFRVQHAPIVGRILWDDSKRVDVESPYESKPEDLLQVSFSWVEAVGASPGVSELNRIFIGTRYTGPILQVDTGALLRVYGALTFHPLFSNKDFGKNYAHGGTWMRGVLPQLRIGDPLTVLSGYATWRDAMSFRFDPEVLRINNRHYTESSALIVDITAAMVHLLDGATVKRRSQSNL
jgi:hypothetical protein